MGIIKRLLCIHPNWKEGRPLSKKKHHYHWDYVTVIGKGRMIHWTCTTCGKTKLFNELYPPLQFKSK